VLLDYKRILNFYLGLCKKTPTIPHVLITLQIALEAFPRRIKRLLLIPALAAQLAAQGAKPGFWQRGV